MIKWKKYSSLGLPIAPLTLWAAFAAALILRFAVSFDDLWLDEIWSINIARNLNHWWEAFFYPHDNNHIINTIWIYFAGETDSYVLLRLPSILMGAALAAIMPLAAIKKTKTETTAALLIGVFAFPLIQYSAEARGYSGALFFSVACYIAAQRVIKGKSLNNLILFWLTAILGILSQLLFLYVYASIAVFTLAYELGKNGTTVKTFRELCKIHAVPLFLMALLYSVYGRMLASGGTEPTGPMGLYNAMQLAWGVPISGWAGIPGIVAAIIVFCAGCATLLKKKDQRLFFFFSVLFAAPAIFLSLTPKDHFHIRHVILCFPFLYLLLAHMISLIFKSRSLVEKSFAAVFLVFLAISSICPTWDLINTGRGQYANAVRFMALNTEDKSITVGGDHDFRTKTVLEYYEKLLPSNKQIIFIDQDEHDENPPQWLFRHSFDPGFKPENCIYDWTGEVYCLASSFPHSGVSGWSWFIYSKEPTPSNFRKLGPWK